MKGKLLTILFFVILFELAIVIYLASTQITNEMELGALIFGFFAVILIIYYVILSLVVFKNRFTDKTKLIVTLMIANIAPIVFFAILFSM